MLEKVNYFEWSRFLEKVNSEELTQAISTKLDESTLRSDLSMYRQILYEEFECHTCFYCGKSLKSKIHVDHFIPWSFVKEDRLYNFVLACPHCNTQKNNKLAPKKFIHDIVISSQGINDVRMSDEVETAMKALRKFMFEKVYCNDVVKCEEDKAMSLIKTLYEHYMNHTDELPKFFLELGLRGEPREKVVCDYISTMTDRFAIALYNDLYVPKFWIK